MQVLYVVIGVLLAIILVGLIVFVCWRYRKYRINTRYNRGKPVWQISNKDVVLFEYDENQQISAETASLYSQVCGVVAVTFNTFLFSRLIAFDCLHFMCIYSNNTFSPL